MHVLLVESEAPVVRLIAWFLVDAGFAVARVAPDGDIVGVADECGAAVVVFNAGILPDAKRRQIELLHNSANSPGVLDVSDGARRALPDTSADAYLMLPFDADDLVAAVRQLAAVRSTQGR